MSTGGTGTNRASSSRVPIPTPDKEPAAQPEDPAPKKSKMNVRMDGHLHFDFGLTGRFISCTGILATMVARWRAVLWRRDSGGVETYESALPKYLHPAEPPTYDWALHYMLLRVLQRPGQHSFLHSTMCVPLLTMQVHGLEQMYVEPDFPFTPVESHVPIPAASYGCYRAQRMFVYEYLRVLGEQLPLVSRFGTPVQRCQPGIAEGLLTPYDEGRLARAAKKASTDAMFQVAIAFGVEPLMGSMRTEAHKYESTEDHPDRYTPTDAYDRGQMQFIVPDCACQGCARVSSRQRFPYVTDNDPSPRYDSEEHSE